MPFIESDLKEFEFSPFKLIGDKWMLITCGDKDKFNTMTASWGGLGVLWNKNVAFVFIRPQRYTFELIEKNDYYTLSFFKDKYKKALSLCGSLSGRDVNKIQKAELTPVHHGGYTFLNEASMVLVCKKLYSDFIDPNFFYDYKIDLNYKNKDYHKMFIGEIEKFLVNDSL